jgi:hypothetical protein
VSLEHWSCRGGTNTRWSKLLCNKRRDGRMSGRQYSGHPVMVMHVLLLFMLSQPLRLRRTALCRDADISRAVMTLSRQGGAASHSVFSHTREPRFGPGSDFFDPNLASLLHRRRGSRLSLQHFFCLFTCVLILS